MNRSAALATRLHRRIDEWFTRPEPNAAGRMGLFRILYAVFYLWHLSTRSTDFLSGVPPLFVEQEVHLVRFVFPALGAALPPGFFLVMESLLVAALVLLAAGYRTRLSTGLVLVIGVVIEALATVVDGKRTLVPLVFYIPFFMLIVDSWGKTYSLDALIRRRTTGERVDPRAADGEYFLGARALLVLFSLWFFIAFVFKVTFGGAWLGHGDMMAQFFLNRNIEAALYDLPLNPLAPWVAATPPVYLGLHVGTLLFEGLFFLSLLSSRVRNLFVAVALLFHAVNALWLVVTVSPILVGYLMFIDWQGLRDRLPGRGRATARQSQSRAAAEGVAGGWPPTRLLVAMVLGTALALGGLWHLEPAVRDLFNLYGLIDWRTIWYPVLPLGLIWLVVTVTGPGSARRRRAAVTV